MNSCDRATRSPTITHCGDELVRWRLYHGLRFGGLYGFHITRLFVFSYLTVSHSHTVPRRRKILVEKRTILTVRSPPPLSFAVMRVYGDIPTLECLALLLIFTSFVNGREQSKKLKFLCIFRIFKSSNQSVIIFARNCTAFARIYR